MRFSMLMLGVLLAPACKVDVKTDADNNGDDDDDDTTGVTEDDLEGMVEDDLQNYASWGQAPAIQGVQVGTSGFHGDWVQIWYNDAALASLDQPADGVAAFKESYSDADGNVLTSIAAMRYADGYGWFYAEITPAEEITDYGRLDVCIGCHESGGADGFLAPTSLGSP